MRYVGSMNLSWPQLHTCVLGSLSKKNFAPTQGFLSDVRLMDKGGDSAAREQSFDGDENHPV